MTKATPTISKGSTWKEQDYGRIAIVTKASRSRIDGYFVDGGTFSHLRSVFVRDFAPIPYPSTSGGDYDHD